MCLGVEAIFTLAESEEDETKGTGPRRRKRIFLFEEILVPAEKEMLVEETF